MHRALTLVLILLVCIPAFAQGQAPAMTNVDATKRADSYVGKMSPEQKIDYIGGTGLLFARFRSSEFRPWKCPTGRSGCAATSGSRDTTLRNGDAAERYQLGHAGIALNRHVFLAGLPKLAKALRSARFVQKGVQLRNSLRSFGLERVL